MVYEIAELQVHPGQEREFEAAVQQAVPIFKRSAGCGGVELQRVVEDAGSYRLVVQWETVEHHTVTFRGGENFAAWRALVGKFFARPPVVKHASTVLRGF
jgi:heme-degrading monooxygenase HmoA